MLFASPEAAPAPSMTPLAEFLGASDPENFLTAFLVLYVLTNALSIIVFNLGFARKLPLLKNVVIYALMLFGNIFITFLAFTLPIIESLFIAGLVLGIYKLQLRRHKKDEEAQPEEDRS
ncbi:YlaH-like family protein [Bacillus daqingensis]|uniref:YlaH-like family protein n=1 Tax=Bacillus daqingensis TaxID=872396 RepID=A0ABV9NU79_9BACI